MDIIRFLYKPLSTKRSPAPVNNHWGELYFKTGRSAMDVSAIMMDILAKHGKQHYKNDRTQQEKAPDV
jgi:hypothetical protein